MKTVARLIVIFTGCSLCLASLSPTILHCDDSATQTTFTSPGYDAGGYPVNTEVFWEIRAPATKRLRVVFIHFDLELHPSCLWDYVEITDGRCYNDVPISGNDVTNVKDVPICGIKLFYEFNSTGDRLCVHFRSDKVVTRKGFKANVSVIKDAAMSPSDPVMSSGAPIVPSTHSSSVSSTNNDLSQSHSVSMTAPVLQSSEDNVQSLPTTPTLPLTTTSPPSTTTTAAAPPPPTTAAPTIGQSQSTTKSTSTDNIPKSTLSNILSSSFTPHQSSPSSATTTTSTYSQTAEVTTPTTTSPPPPATNTSPPPSPTTAPKSTTYFDQTHLTLPDVTLTICNTSVLNEDLSKVSELEIRSPVQTSGQHQGKYPVNRHCSLVLNNQWEKTINIEFKAFDLEFHPSCIWDYLIINLGVNSTGKKCGDTVPTSMTTTSGVIQLIFNSDSIMPANGFVVVLHVQKDAEQASTPIASFTTNTIASPGENTVTESSEASSTAQTMASPSSIAAPSVNQTSTVQSSDVTSAPIQQMTVNEPSAADTQISTTQPTTLSSPETIPTISQATNNDTNPFHSTVNMLNTSTAAISTTSATVNVTPTFTTTKPTPTIDDSGNLPQETSSITQTTTAELSPSSSNPTVSESPPTSAPTTNPVTVAADNDVIDICQVSNLQMKNMLSIVTPGFLAKENYPINTDCSMEVSAPDDKEVAMTIQDFDMELNTRCTWDHLTLEQSGSATRLCGYLDKWHSQSSQFSCFPNYLRTIDEESLGMKCILQGGTKINLGKLSPLKLKFHSDGYVPRKGFNISLIVMDKEDTPITVETSVATDPLTTTQGNAVNLTSSPATVPSLTTAVPSPTTTASSTTASLNTSMSTLNSLEEISPPSIMPVTDTTEHINTTTSATSTTTPSTLSTVIPTTMTVKANTATSKSTPITSDSSSLSPAPSSATTTTSSPTKTSPTATTLSSTTTSSSPTTTTSSPTATASSPTATASSPTTASSSTTSASNVVPTEAPNACSGDGQPLVIFGGSGYLESPGYKEQANYPPNTHCLWKIKEQKEKVIVIIFESFALEDSKSCQWDKLAFYSLSANGTVTGTLKVLCGSRLPATIHTTEDLLIEFVADSIQHRRGFRLKYITSETGEVGGKVCPAGYTLCMDSSRCIPVEWWCDGITDCDDMSDESQCVKCKNTEFQCGNGTCISRTQRCDQRAQCAFSEDETGCVLVPANSGSPVTVHLNGVSKQLCFGTEAAANADKLCRMAGYRSATASWPDQDGISSGSYLTLTKDTDGKMSFLDGGTCSEDKATMLACSESGCGQKHASYRKKRIIGGSVASAGEWPWHVALRSGSKVVCGASIINRNWVLTAGHCVNNVYNNPQILSIVAGTNDMNDDSGQIIYVSEILIHPNYNFIFNADIALLKLQRPLVFDDNVQPICLPWDMRQFSPSAPCFVAGYGVYDMKHYYTTIAPRFLRNVRTKIVSVNACRSAYAYRTYIQDSMICAGYVGGGMDACKGDSGGGLMCETDDGRWVLAGIVSWGDKCGSTRRPGVYTRVTSFIQWIDENTDPETMTANCTFEDGWCGYEDVSPDKYFWTRIPGDKYVKGTVMYASRSPSELPYQPANATLLSPTFTNAADSCLNFRFLFSSNSNVTLSVIGVSDSSDVNRIELSHELLWQVTSNYPSMDTWKSTEVSIPANVIRLKFVSIHTEGGVYGVGLDNVTLRTNTPCGGLTFMACDFNGNSTCLYKEWTGTFLHPWQLTERAEDNNDHYLRAGGTYDEFGYMAVSQLVSPPVSAAFMSLPHCVHFSYNILNGSNSELVLATFIAFGPNIGTPVVFWRSVGADDGLWSNSKVTIDNGFYNHIVFEVRRTDNMYSSHLLQIGIDNIYVTEGNCV